MGYIRHHAIIVTDDCFYDNSKKDNIYNAREAAIKSGCKFVTDVVQGAINNTYSFMVCPDGSKEGWTDSNAGDEVSYGYKGGDPEITRHHNVE